MMLRPRALKMGALFVSTGILVAGFAYWAKSSGFAFTDILLRVAPKSLVTKEMLAQALGDSNAFFKFPSEMDLPIGPNGTDKLHTVVQYTFDPKLQESMEAIFRSYAPDYGALVAMDAITGRVLAMVSYSRDPLVKDNLALRATFPSASIFKVVTAAAAIQESNYNANTVIQFSGANHTLYRSNILRMRTNRWSRYSTLKDSFAKSINTVFGRIGAFTVGPEKLKVYANRFGFNRKIAGDLPLHQGSALIGEDPWGLAQTASGYTRDNTMSPMQGALMAAAIANDGVMMEPYVVQSVYTPDGVAVYAAEPTVSSIAVDADTASQIRSLMNETITRGTSRKSFRGFFKGENRVLDVGGKTGSLTGMDPPGKYDWFVGYANGGSHRIAVAALTIHRKLWRVKSSHIARKAIENYFQAHSIHDIAEGRNVPAKDTNEMADNH